MEDALVRLETWVKNDDTAVLILVLMEDALALAERSEDCKEVLILVVMEDALALPKRVADCRSYAGLNPCCNGRCTRTWRMGCEKIRCSTHLNPCCNGRCTRTNGAKIVKNLIVRS